MALNFSHRPLFPACLPEDNLVSHMRVPSGYPILEGIPEKADGCFVYPMDGSDRSGPRGSQEPVHEDILDLLPSDPFGMDISDTFTMITGWLEDLEVDYAGHGRDQTVMDEANSQFLAGFDFIWNNMMGFQAFPGGIGFHPKSEVVGGFDCWNCQEKEGGGISAIQADQLACNAADFMTVEDAKMEDSDVGFVDERCREFTESCSLALNEQREAPHAALTFALAHLGVRDLLVVESVCKSLHFTVQNDPLLWRSIHIDQPLNEKITDDILMQLAERAQGNLQCLSLVECPRITDEGLKHVVENNPRLTKLSVPGCTRLSIDGILASLRALKGVGAQGVKQLRIGGLYGVTPNHFEELRILLGAEDHMSGSDHRPHYYHRGNLYYLLEDDRAIDIEACPRCENLRLVYDCPLQGCEGKAHPTKACRACTLCIARCVQCGRCIYDGEYEETFCLELLCSECWKLLPPCQGQETNRESPNSP